MSVTLLVTLLQASRTSSPLLMLKSRRGDSCKSPPAPYTLGSSYQSLLPMFGVNLEITHISHWFDKNNAWPNNKCLMEPCELSQEPTVYTAPKKANGHQATVTEILSWESSSPLTWLSRQRVDRRVWSGRSAVHPGWPWQTRERLKKSGQDSTLHEQRPQELGMFSMRKRIRSMRWLKHPQPVLAHYTVQY